jgi:hypothetical protein
MFLQDDTHAYNLSSIVYFSNKTEQDIKKFCLIKLSLKMTLADQFQLNIDEILNKTHITVIQAADVKKHLSEVIPNVGEIDKIQLDKIIEATEHGQLLAPRKKEIRNLYPKALEIVKKYVEEYESEENPDSIDEDRTVEEVEELLDQKIPVYNGYTKKNPIGRD